MSKVLFFDIDGTLIDYHGNMPASTKFALEQAHDAGHQIVICSGRARFQMAEELLSMSDGVIGCTGANVEAQGKTLYEHFMTKEILEQIIEVLNAASAKIILMSETTTIMNHDAYDYMLNKFAAEYGLKDKFHTILGNPVITNEFDGFSDVKKVLYYDSAWDIQQLTKELGSICDVTASSFEKKEEDSGEITCKGINKSYGMQKYIEFQNIPKEDTIAFGDGPNDMDMIEYAHIGVVMGNGRDELKKRADFITKDIGEDGIYYAMKALHLID